MSTTHRNGPSGATATPTRCESCNAEGPVIATPGAEWDGFCAVCAARMQGWDNGWRAGALLALGRAVENALAAPNCTPVMVRQAFEVALAGNTHEDHMLTLAGGKQLPVWAFEPHKPSRALAAWDNTGGMVRASIQAGDIQRAAGWAHGLARELAQMVPKGAEGSGS